MKRVLLVGLVLGCMVVGGCSGLQARGVMAVKINANSDAAAAILVRTVAAPLTDAEARGYLNENATKFAEYADAKTVNWFAYAFGNKTIFVNGEYATRLDIAKVLAQETANRAETNSPTSAWLNAAVLKECTVLMDVRAAKDGKGISP
jgi:hypothetical protein